MAVTRALKEALWIQEAWEDHRAARNGDNFLIRPDERLGSAPNSEVGLCARRAVRLRSSRGLVAETPHLFGLANTAGST